MRPVKVLIKIARMRRLILIFAGLTCPIVRFLTLRQDCICRILPTDNFVLMQTGPEVIKLFSCSTQPSMKFSLLMNKKMPISLNLKIMRLIIMFSYL